MGLSEREKQIAQGACGVPSRMGVSLDGVYAAVEAVLAERAGMNAACPSCGEPMYEHGNCGWTCPKDAERTPTPEQCPHCGPNCLGGAAHNARAEDGVVYAPEQPTRFPRGIPAPYFEEDVEVKQPAAASDVVAEMLRAYDECTADKYAGMDGAIMGMTAALQVANKAWEKAIREEWDACESQSDIDLGEYPDFIKRLQSRMGSAKC